MFQVAEQGAIGLDRTASIATHKDRRRKENKDPYRRHICASPQRRGMQLGWVCHASPRSRDLGPCARRAAKKRRAPETIRGSSKDLQRTQADSVKAVGVGNVAQDLRTDAWIRVGSNPASGW